MTQFTPIETALEELRQGRMVILVDDDKREQEGDLIIPAEKVTAETINFMVKYARGLICLPLTEEVVQRLQIPMMAEYNKTPNQAAFTMSIESAEGVTTGVSAADRARTIRVAVNPKSVPADISMPGHVFPLKARAGGVLVRPGHTEGSVDLARLAGFQPAAAICEIMKDDGSMARLPDLQAFAALHDIKIVSIEDLIAYRLTHETIVDEIASANLPLEWTDQFVVKIFRHRFDGSDHMALVHKNFNPSQPTLVRIHSECLTGDVFGSILCDCGAQLKKAMTQIAEENGILLYMRQEGRGIGLGNKVKAYELQQSQGLDTVEANQSLGFQADLRSYGMSAQMLRQLGVSRIRLLTNNPAKVRDMQRFGIEVVERVPVEIPPNPNNIHYLTTKREKLGHILNLK
ncbi:MAG: 3,4-dihydroxy-2-butanone-4-phosphate synthase [Gammaproteobacteria bacterium]|nr:3,4-dihydroxy-2-butanone-4-phosphate synthase [Gammaproteobacteria bacterium]